jgi:DNA-binding MurR/RpiR family transcriptional regulator
MPLFSESEIKEMHTRYLQKQAALDGERPRSKAEILVDVVRQHPDATVRELAEAAEMSPSWIRRTLKAAGLKAAPARRQRKSEQEEAQ